MTQRKLGSPRRVQYTYAGGDGLDLQQERTEDGASVQTL